MDPATDPDVREQRLLAAIVFTDVVGFSRLTAKNEARVYGALQRDMGIMTDLCRSHGGRVLNTMGDGMLMSFPSAVDAMACAVEIQRTLANQSLALPPTEVLHHRIGVHLGDIIMKGDNVFGEGVNIAARLQNDARPDSIWFSETVQNVIKNKLKFDSRYVGPRMFKNLGEVVKVWEVPPIAEINAQLHADAAGVGTVLAVPESDGVRGGRAFLLILGSVFLIGIVVFMVLQAKRPPQSVTRGGPTKPRVQTPVADPPATTGTTPQTNTTGAPATTGSSVPPEATGIVPEAVLARIQELKAQYDFVGLVDFLAREGRLLPDAAALSATYNKLAAFRQWIESEVGRSTPADPISVSLSTGVAEIVGTPEGPQIAFNRQGYAPFDFAQLIPADVIALARALEARPTSMVPSDLAEYMTVFSQEYQL